MLLIWVIAIQVSNCLQLYSKLYLTNLYEEITEATCESIKHMVHVQQNIMRHRPMVNLIDKLGNLPISRSCNFDRFFFWNSGSEAGKSNFVVNLKLILNEYSRSCSQIGKTGKAFR